jgi:hypothetical protein
MVVSFEAFTAGVGLTVIVTLSFAVHLPPGLAVTKYWVVADGDADGLAAVGLDKPADGLQPKEPALVLFVTSCMVLPLQMAVSAMVAIVGWGVTLMVTESFAVQLLLYCTCTTYTVDTGGVATGLGMVESLRLPEGDHAKVTLGDAVDDKCTLTPEHMAVSPKAVTVGDGLRLMLTESVAEHLPLFTVSTYLMFVGGVANGLTTVESDKPVPGDQL